jgi:hypothetical protein
MEGVRSKSEAYHVAIERATGRFAWSDTLATPRRHPTSHGCVLVVCHDLEPFETGNGMARTRCGTVSALAGMPRRCVSRAPASPPQETPTPPWAVARRRVRRTRGASRFGKGSANVRRGQAGLRQWNRRTRRLRRTSLPKPGRSVGGIGYGRTGSSCDRTDRKHQDASPGRRREDLPDQHPPPQRCGSPGSSSSKLG